MFQRRTDPQWISCAGPLDTECWVWQWSTKDGYGYMWDSQRGTSRRSHAVFYERRHGQVPTGLQLDHLCENRACVNPDHLEPVTQTINIRRGRHTKLTTESVLAIRAIYALGGVRQIDLAHRYGVTQSVISHAITGRTWRGLEPDVNQAVLDRLERRAP